MAAQDKKPILFGLAGEPLTDCVTDTEQEAETVEEALEKAVKCMQTRYLKALELEAEFVILPDVEKAQQELFVTKTAEETEECLRVGAQVNARNINGWTPLHCASYNGRERVVEMLLARGASVDARATSRTPLHFASMWGHLSVVEMLLARGASVNARDNYDTTPLGEASYNGHERMVEMLLASGADANARDNRGRTPLHWVSQRGHARVAELLRAHGATDDGQI